MTDRTGIQTQLNNNLLLINAALDSRDRRKFLLLAKRRHDLRVKLARIPAEV